MWLSVNAKKSTNGKQYCDECAKKNDFKLRNHWRCIQCKGVFHKGQFSQWIASRKTVSNKNTARCNACKDEQNAADLRISKSSLEHFAKWVISITVPFCSQMADQNYTRCRFDSFPSNARVHLFWSLIVQLWQFSQLIHISLERQFNTSWRRFNTSLRELTRKHHLTPLEDSSTFLRDSSTCLENSSTLLRTVQHLLKTIQRHPKTAHYPLNQFNTTRRQCTTSDGHFNAFWGQFNTC